MWYYHRGLAILTNTNDLHIYIIYLHHASAPSLSVWLVITKYLINTRSCPFMLHGATTLTLCLLE